MENHGQNSMGDWEKVEVPDVPPISADLTSAACMVIATTPIAKVSTECQRSVVLTNLPGNRCTFLDIVADEHLSQIDSNGLRRD